MVTTPLGFSGRAPFTSPNELQRGRPGLIQSLGAPSESLINAAAELPKIATLTLSTASDDQVLTIDGITVTTAFDTDDDTTAAAIAGNINNDSVLRSIVKASVSSATVTITGKLGGFDFPISYSGTGGTLTTDGSGDSQVATTNPTIEFGLVVGFNSGDLTNWTDATLPCRYPNSGSTIIRGIAGGSTIRQTKGLTVPGYNRGEEVTIARFRTQSRIWAQFEESASSIVPGESVFYRHTANGSLDQLGILTTTDDGGNTEALGDALTLSPGLNYGDRVIALVEI